MTDERSPGGFSLSRWSRRKLEAARAGSAPTTPAESVPAAPVIAASSSGAATPDKRPAPGAPLGVAATDPTPTACTGANAADTAAPLLPIDSLGPDADYTGFFKPSVAPSLRNAALKKLFADPRFNVMDGLDTYIDDYSVSVPLSAEEARGLVQARAILNPPRMRVNAQGHVEPVPPEDLAAEAPPTEAVEGPTSEGPAAEAAATESATEAARGVTAPDTPDARAAAPAQPEPDAPPSGAPAPSRHR